MPRPRLLQLLMRFARASRVIAIVCLALATGALAADPTPDPRCGGWKDCDLPETPTPIPGDRLGVIRDRIDRITTVPKLDVRRDVTFLDLGETSILWEWRDEPGISSSEEWTHLKSLSEVVKLEPETEYTFEVVALADCDNVKFDYAFKAEAVSLLSGTSYVLRILKGDEVVFDAHAQASVHEAKSTIPVAKECQPDERLAHVTTEILHAQALLQEDEVFQKAVSASGDPNEAPPSDVVVRIEQGPLGIITILVYDPGARERDSVEVTVFDAACRGEYVNPGEIVKLRQARRGSPVFLGRHDVDAVDVLVKAQYEQRGKEESSLFQSNEIFVRHAGGWDSPEVESSPSDH